MGRQNGKTHLLKVLALWMMYSGNGRLVLGSAQNLAIAREAWEGVSDIIEGDAALTHELAHERRSAGDYEISLKNGARYRITAANGKAGRGLSVDLLILDELREHRDWAPWAALSATTNARPNALVVCISNAGDERSVVLNSLRDRALAGEDETLGLFEWSAPKDCELDDAQAFAQANPGLGHTITERSILGQLATMPPGHFRTEVLCQRVDAIDTALDLGAWQECGDAHGTLEDARGRIAACLDVSLDMKHVSLVAAAQRPDGRTRLEVVAAWNSTSEARAALPDLLARVNPQVLGWFPGGPAASIAADLRGLRKSQALKAGDVPAVCQGFADQITARRVIQPQDPLLNAQASQTAKVYTGDGWRFTRRLNGHCDAIYAAAGAVHLARTMPAPVGKPRVIVAA